MKSKSWLILLASLGVILLASSVGVTRASFLDLESSSDNTFEAWTSILWQQTTKEDFEAGVPDNVDSSSSPGDVKLQSVTQEPTTSVGSEESWWDTSWSRRAPVVINNPGSSLTDYQVKVDVTYDADMQPDFDDIRFVDSDDSTPLSHWREDYVASASAIFWVRVPSIPSGNKTIYMYYGNAAASSESNKENTMVIVDVQVEADADDGEEDGRIAGTHSWKTGGYYSDNAMFLGYAESYDRPFEIAWRWDNITASGKALDGCKIKIWHNDDHTESGTSDNVTLYGIDEPDPVAFSVTDNTSWPSNRNRTTASVSWNPPPETAHGTHELAESPSIKTIIQELLDSYNYTGTQAMAFYWRVESSSTWWRNYDGYGLSGTPTLHIEYRKYVEPEPTTSVGSEESWWDTSWSRRAPVVINNPGSSLTDYQVKVDVTYDADMQPDFDDIRFVDSDDSTELSHWREDYTASASATFWIKVPSIPSGAKTIYIYYGNAAASSASDGTATFLFYDDFEEHAAGEVPDGWTMYSGCSGIIVQDDAGNKVLDDGTGSGGNAIAGSPSWTDIACRQRFRAVDDVVDHAGVVVRYADESNEVYGGIVSDTTAGIWNRIGGTWTQIGGTWTIPDVGTSWHVQELRIAGDTVELYIDDEDIGSGTLTSGAPTSGASGFWCQYSRQGYRDEHIIRKYAPQRTYVSSGTVASQVLDTGVAGARSDALFWDETLESNTAITFEVRASDNLFAKDAEPDPPSVPGWISVGGTSPVTSGLPSGRYMQWRATLTTSDTSKTPTLREGRVYHY